MMSMQKRVKQALFPAYATALGHLPARWSIAIEHLRCVGRWPDLDAPQTFNEKSSGANCMAIASFMPG